LVLFGAIEGQALANKRQGDTLSETVWRWFSIRHKGRWWRTRRLALLSFLAWLVAHFVTGGKF
jgi:hypothetical protein